MVADPGAVSANWHNTDLEGPARSNVPEQRRQSGVSSKQKSLSFTAQDVAVIASWQVAGPALPPVLDFKSLNFNLSLGIPKFRSVAPSQFSYVRQPGVCEQI